MYAIVKFYRENGRKMLPIDGYSPITVFDDNINKSARFHIQAGSWGWDKWLPVRLSFVVQEDVKPHQAFKILEGSKVVGEGLTW